jgi:dephospho-CoA kinase
MSPSGGPDAKVLVVTGQTGTGKSTVCRWLAARGAFVIDADRVGHELLLDETMVRELVGAFGDGILDEQGAIDRKRLGPLVFADERALKRLGELVHPALVAEIQRRIQALRGSRAVELIVVDAALHFVFQPRLDCDAVLYTTVSGEEQLRRIMRRDSLDASAAAERVARQSEIPAHAAEADVVLDTTAEAGRVRQELLLNVDAVLGTRLAESDPPAPAEGWKV